MVTTMQLMMVDSGNITIMVMVSVVMTRQPRQIHRETSLADAAASGTISSECTIRLEASDLHGGSAVPPRDSGDQNKLSRACFAKTIAHLVLSFVWHAFAFEQTNKQTNTQPNKTHNQTEHTTKQKTQSNKANSQTTMTIASR